MPANKINKNNISMVKFLTFPMKYFPFVSFYYYFFYLSFFIFGRIPCSISKDNQVQLNGKQTLRLGKPLNEVQKLGPRHHDPTDYVVQL